MPIVKASFELSLQTFSLMCSSTYLEDVISLDILVLCLNCFEFLQEILWPVISEKHQPKLIWLSS